MKKYECTDETAKELIRLLNEMVHKLNSLMWGLTYEEKEILDELKFQLSLSEEEPCHTPKVDTD